MRKLFKLLAVICITISACGSEPKNAGEETLSDTSAVSDKSVSYNLDSDNTVQIDSSEYVMYPLANKQQDDDSGSFISKDRGTNTYWNIIFYNTATKKSHLLNDSKKMVIVSYNQDNSDSYSSGKSKYQSLDITQVKSYIFYSVITTDFNKDGRLDYHNPAYLFISDKQGNNFKQISPDYKNVVNWQLIEKSGAVLFNTVTDKNNDKVFDEKDVTIPYTYDLKTGKPAEEVFPAEFSEMVNKAHNKQWPAKKK